ncbi:SsrA-binding protein SmpB [Marinoscillum furvescens]|uniref:SsrA-binding protein n=1 Tax=Marinoscillum furvescens DSM 4134 TaxID=1122208 RepID=A0A3D9LIM6_MARFU|nr:SsrA-binding protein SmpB [Marinoscillum furvescens]REE05715.1 SsrA-binding protein [Marinoscillum furvescens DSM 4134]
MAKNQPRFSNNIHIKNRKASYEYEFLDKYEAGIVLKGTEIKAIREGKASVQEAYCYLKKGELFIKGMNISPYSNSSFQSHDMTRERKLLLKRKELEKIQSKTEEKGLTIVPTRLYINKRGYAKLEIAVSRGKKLHDKRDSIKKKDQDRELKRMRI